MVPWASTGTIEKKQINHLTQYAPVKCRVENNLPKITFLTPSSSVLQKQNVPSVYVWFPDEGHSVRKPVHRKLYYKMILDWFDHFLKGKPSNYLEMAGHKENFPRDSGETKTRR